MSLHLPTLLTAHVWMLFALTVMVGMLWRIIRKPSLKNWFYSDLWALIGIVAFYFVIDEPTRPAMIAFALSTWFTIYFRVIALSQPDFARPFRRVALSAIAALFALNVFADASLANLRTFCNSIVFASLCACLLYVLMRSSARQSRFGRSLIAASALAYGFAAVLRAGHALVADANVLFAATTFNTLTSSSMILLGVLAHIGFVVIAFDELNQAESEAAQTAIREAERRSHAEERERESNRVAEEQKGFIEVLTHEVRQPLNNASAALQSIGTQLVAPDGAAQTAAIARAQAVIDKVATALSNALVAATILERRQQFNPVRCDHMLLVEMVTLDFNVAERARLETQAQNAPLYVTADPILLRIALRNLIENALRYSPPGAPVIVRVAENDADMGVEFSVENVEKNAAWIEGVDIFERRVRGPDVNASGSGMGLYITSEIAKLHQGWIRTRHEDGRRIFTLFLAD